MHRRGIDHATRLNSLYGFGEVVQTIRMDIGLRSQTNEFFAAVSVHRSGSGISLDDALGRQIVNDQSVADSFENSPILLVFFFKPGRAIPVYTHMFYLVCLGKKRFTERYSQT
jgi:hypothetical protein